MHLDSAFMLHDRYLIEALLGHGGMGAVYRALDTLTDQPCAVKEFRLQDFSGDGGGKTGRQEADSSDLEKQGISWKKAIRQFKREAKLMVSLDHPAIPKVIDFFGVEKEYYLVMTLIEGQNLAEYSDLMGGKPIPLDHVMRWMDVVIDALVYCHGQDIIHRDVKPGNILISDTNNVFLVDFGIAKSTEISQVSTPITQVMSPGFSPPEQYTGIGRTDERSDVYSVGATIYKLVTGRRPTEAVARVMGNVLPTLADLVPAIPPAINEAIVRAMALQPNDRFSTMEELQLALQDGMEMLELKGADPQFSLDFQQTISRSEAQNKEESPEEAFAVLDSLQAQALKLLMEADEAGKSGHAVKESGEGVGRLTLSFSEQELQKRTMDDAPTEGDEKATQIRKISHRGGEDDLPAQDLMSDLISSGERSETYPFFNEVIVCPEGTGQYQALEEAVEMAPTGSVIYIRPGTYHVKRPLKIDRPLYLKGDDCRVVEIISEDEEYAVLVENDASAQLECISFRHMGEMWADVVVIESGSIKISECSFEGALVNSRGNLGGCGIRFLGATQGDIYKCTVSDNTLHGIEIGDTANVILKENTCTNNGKAGISFIAFSGGAATKNVCNKNRGCGVQIGGSAEPEMAGNICTHNEQAGALFFGQAGGSLKNGKYNENMLHGIQISGEARPKLISNECSGNHQVGVQYLEDASGQAKSNTCTGNHLHGVCVSGRAWPGLEENNCSGNNQVGIMFFGSSLGTVKKNICNENGYHGIEISEQAKPELEKNHCYRNKQVGLRYSGHGTGLAHSNTLEENAYYGVEVIEQAYPRVEKNFCRENGGAGMIFSGNSGGVARMNRCDNNAYSGMQIEGTARPTLKTNICRNNKQCGILFTDQAGGLAYDNRCIENGFYGIHVLGQASPRIEASSCHKNGNTGIAFTEKSTGSARENECVLNGEYGIAVLDQAQPEIDKNDLSENGIMDMKA